MRAEVLSESAEGQQIAQMMNDGKTIPGVIYAGLFSKALEETLVPKEDKGKPSACFLVDGFPRSKENATLFEEQVGAPRAAIVLTADEKLAVERLQKGNANLDADACRKRIGTFVKRTMPMVEQLVAAGLQVTYLNTAAEDDAVLKAMAITLGWEEGDVSALLPPAEVPAAPPPADELEDVDDTPRATHDEPTEVPQAYEDAPEAA